MQRAGARLLFLKVASAHREHIPLGELGQSRRILLCTLFRLAPYLAPSGARYDRAAHLERNACTLHTDGGDLFQTRGRERLDHAAGDHIVDFGRIRRKSRGRMAGDEQSMVVCHLPAVHRTVVQLSARQVGSLMAETRMAGERGQQRGYLLEHILRNIAAPRAGIGDELLFVKFLRDAERLFCRESMPRVGLFLESGQVVQQRRLLGCIAAFDLYNLHAVAAPDCGTGFVRRRFRIVFRRREGGEGRSVFGRVEFEPEIGLRRE